MAKRFTSTDKWKDPWFRKLSDKHKLFWQYILDNCNSAGIWNIDFELAGMMIGHEMGMDELKLIFEKRIEFLSGEYCFVRGFPEFQYGRLTPDCKPHRPVIAVLQKFGLWERVSKGYQVALEGHKDKEKEQEQEKDSLEEKGVEKETKPLTDVQKIVTAYKLLEGTPRDDKNWDKVYFPRYSKQAKDLLTLLGDYRTAIICMESVAEKLQSLNRSYTFETIVKHAAEWKKDNLEKMATRS